MKMPVSGAKLASDLKYYTDYSKYLDDLGRFETWEESVDRVMNMHRKKYAEFFSNEYFANMFEFSTKMYKQKRVLASQRALQFGGDPIIKHNSKLYNCLTSYADRVDFFGETFYWLLSGCGVGFSVQYKHHNKLPKIKSRGMRTKTFIVPDSIEGWAEAVDALMSSYFVEGGNHPEYRGCRVNFDYSLIRPKGSYISGGFKAPGPDGLRKSIILIEELFESVLHGKETAALKPIHVYDIVMYLSDAVLSGGVRRSATICLFSLEDDEMMSAKTGDWYLKHPQRARSNNSVVLLRDKVTKEQFDKIKKSVQQFGEPGFVWTDDEDIIYNPCVEIGMYPQTEDGVSGWQGCNLCEINGSLATTKSEFIDACAAASFIGTLQAGYTDFKYVKPESKQIFDREALLGVSITGFMTNPDILLNEEIQRIGAKTVVEVNARTAKIININQAARTTCVKPSGNASVLLQTSSGIHGEHSKRYFRVTQINKDEEIAQYFHLHHSEMVEESAWSRDKTDYVIYFPVEAGEKTIFKDELNGVKLLEYVKLTQQNWVEYGTNKHLCVNPNTRHNVSNTVIVDDWDTVFDYIYNNRKYLAGVSLLPKSGDKDFVQAPFTSVLSPEEILLKYGEGSMLASGLIVDGLHAFSDNLWSACDTLLGYGLDLSKDSEKNAIRRDWIRRAKQFANRYFNGDTSKTTYCLKDVHLLHKWLTISKTIKEVYFNSILTKPKYTDIDTTGSVACTGGNCEIPT